MSPQRPYPQYPPRSDADLLELIGRYPLAWVVPTAAPFTATPLPLLAEPADGTGRLQSLFGHLDRANPMIEVLVGDPRAVVLFSGPQGYIAPALLDDPPWAPTWNYSVIRIETTIEFLPAETDEALHRLVGVMEADADRPWTIEQMGDRYEPRKALVIAFRARIERLHATFKLGQDETAEDFEAIVTNLPDRELAEWMRRTRPDGDGR